MTPGQPVAVPPGQIWGAWNTDWAIIAALVLAGIVYAAGWRRLQRAARPPVGPRHAAAFAGAWVALAIALLSPLDALAGTLLSAHMGQHLLLLMVAPPLLAAARPGLVLRMGLPRAARTTAGEWMHALRPVTRWANQPLVVLVVSTVALWAWHVPAFYDAAVTNAGLHAAEHLSFLGTEFLFWRLVIDPAPRRRLAYPGAMLLTFAVLLQGAALGALLTLAPTVLYPVYRDTAALWGTTALADQHLAGALMWVPPGGAYLVTIVALAAAWFRQMDRRMPRREPGLAVATPEAGP